MDQLIVTETIVALVAAIVFHGRSDVPSFDSVIRPASLLSAFFVDKYFGACWGKGCFVEIECSEQIGICRELRVGMSIA